MGREAWWAGRLKTGGRNCGPTSNQNNQASMPGRGWAHAACQGGGPSRRTRGRGAGGRAEHAVYALPRHAAQPRGRRRQARVQRRLAGALGQGRAAAGRLAGQVERRQPRVRNLGGWKDWWNEGGERAREESQCLLHTHSQGQGAPQSSKGSGAKTNATQSQACLVAQHRVEAVPVWGLPKHALCTGWLVDDTGAPLRQACGTQLGGVGSTCSSTGGGSNEALEPQQQLPCRHAFPLLASALPAGATSRSATGTPVQLNTQRAQPNSRV